MWTDTKKEVLNQIEIYAEDAGSSIDVHWFLFFPQYSFKIDFSCYMCVLDNMTHYFISIYSKIKWKQLIYNTLRTGIPILQNLESNYCSSFNLCTITY